LHPPLVVDVDNDGLAELVYLSLDVPPAGAVSALSIYDASGRPWHGFPLELDPPAVSSLVVASTPSGAKRLVFVREDGSIAVYDPLQRSLESAAEISLATDPSVTLAACDVDYDAEDEILLATGGDSLDCLDPGGGSWTRETVFEREYSAIVAVASGMTKNGSPVACAYDEAFHQFVFLSGGHTSFVSHTTARAGQKLVSLSRGPSLGEGGNVFVAVFFEPATEKDVEKVFEKHATPKMREAAARDVSPQSTEESKRQLKRSLLVEQFGEEEADEMLNRPAATEVLLLGSGGSVLGGAPIRVDDHHPFVAEDGTNALRPAVLYEPSEAKLFVLVGLCEDMPGGAAYVRMYEVPCR
jgi:hypothetical protein